MTSATQLGQILARWLLISIKWTVLIIIGGGVDAVVQ